MKEEASATLYSMYSDFVIDHSNQHTRSGILVAGEEVTVTVGLSTGTDKQALLDKLSSAESPAVAGVDASTFMLAKAIETAVKFGFERNIRSIEYEKNILLVLAEPSDDMDAAFALVKSLQQRGYNFFLLHFDGFLTGLSPSQRATVDELFETSALSAPVAPEDSDLILVGHELADMLCYPQPITTTAPSKAPPLSTPVPIIGE